MYEDLKAFKKLLDEGAITEEDYARQKSRILGIDGTQNEALGGAMASPSVSSEPEAISNLQARHRATNGRAGIDTVEELRKYKSLFDEGILTQEEFDAKKAQILGTRSVAIGMANGGFIISGKGTDRQGRGAQRVSKEGVIAGMRGLLSLLVYLLASLQVVLGVYTLAYVGWFRYLTSFYIDYFLSEETNAVILLAASSVVSALAVRSGSMYAKGEEGRNGAASKGLAGAGAALCVVAIVPLTAAVEGRSIVDHTFNSEWMMLFACVAVVLAVASVWLCGKVRRSSDEAKRLSDEGTGKCDS